jgi:hypothetical protein
VSVAEYLTLEDVGSGVGRRVGALEVGMVVGLLVVGTAVGKAILNIAFTMIDDLRAAAMEGRTVGLNNLVALRFT